MIRRLLGIVAVVFWAYPACAHEVRPALLKVTEVGPGNFLVHWKVPAMGNQRLSVDPIFESSCALEDDVVAGFSAGASVQSWKLTCDGELAGTSIQFSNLSFMMIDVLVQVSFLDGRFYTGLVRPSDPVFTIPDRDGQASVFGNYFTLGVDHILMGWDHLLFVVGMMLIIVGYRRLLWAVTGFTVAHSVTLALAALDLIRVPGPPVEAVIALSILLLAVEARRFQQTNTETLTMRYPWLISSAIGLIHGLGFAGALSEYGLPGHARVVSLLGFNLGVEAGQLAFIGVIVALGTVALRLAKPVVVPVRIGAMWFIGVCGSYWFVERLTGFW